MITERLPVKLVPKNEGHYPGKVALITGAAQGIGLATADLLSSYGASVMLSDITEELLEEETNRLAKRGRAVDSRVSDVSSAEACQALVDATIERFGRLDILINNAGISIVSLFEDCTAASSKKLVDVNLLGSIYTTLAALDELKRNQGHIVFLGSVAGIRAIPTGALYSASKAALRSLAESLRVELAPSGVHVGVIAPGFTTTDAAKTVMRGDGSLRPINRPPHDTPEGVARGIARMIEQRERERVLTPLGRVTQIAQRLSPELLDLYLERNELQD